MGAGRVVVLSHGFWTRAFGEDPGVLTESLVLDGQAYRIVGAADPELDFPEGGDFWVPAATDFAREFGDFRYLGVVGRIPPGSEMEESRVEMERISRAIGEENPGTNQGWGWSWKSCWMPR